MARGEKKSDFMKEQRLVVGISDMKVTDNPAHSLITFSLGSCIGITLWDSHAHVAGLLHYMLPDAALDKERAKTSPYMFGSTGIPLLFHQAYRLGAVKNRLKICVVGGSQLMDSAGIFNVGTRNYEMVQHLFAKNGIRPDKVDVGGAVNRTISVHAGTGRVILKVSGKEEVEL